jgi:hypothetical protein
MEFKKKKKREISSHECWCWLGGVFFRIKRRRSIFCSLEVMVDRCVVGLWGERMFLLLGV